MKDGPDFLSKAESLMVEAQLLGATFRADGSWAMKAGLVPLPSTLTDRLRVHRAAVAALVAEKAT